MFNVTIDEIQQDPLKYLRQVEAGATFVIIQADKPIAELRPISTSKPLRPFGLCAGQFSVPDDFDAPIPEEILSTFEGK
jgi:antitoxin (DNA-binding transcriptional repressor) of toxin-antitoxin stability system